MVACSPRPRYPYPRHWRRGAVVTEQVIQDRKAGMGPGPGGGHEHIHCSLKLLDRAQVPDQVAGGGRMISGTGRQEGIAGGGSAGGQPLAVVAAKYYFNGDSNVVFRYRLYSFYAYPVRVGRGWTRDRTVHACKTQLRSRIPR